MLSRRVSLGSTARGILRKCKIWKKCKRSELGEERRQFGLSEQESPPGHLEQTPLYGQENRPREVTGLAQRHLVRPSMAPVCSRTLMCPPLNHISLRQCKASLLRTVDDWVPLTSTWPLLPASETVIHTVPPEVPLVLRVHASAGLGAF